MEASFKINEFIFDFCLNLIDMDNDSKIIWIWCKKKHLPLKQLNLVTFIKVIKYAKTNFSSYSFVGEQFLKVELSDKCSIYIWTFPWLKNWEFYVWNTINSKNVLQSRFVFFVNRKLKSYIRFGRPRENHIVLVFS